VEIVEGEEIVAGGVGEIPVCLPPSLYETLSI